MTFYRHFYVYMQVLCLSRLLKALREMVTCFYPRTTGIRMTALLILHQLGKEIRRLESRIHALRHICGEGEGEGG